MYIGNILSKLKRRFI